MAYGAHIYGDDGETTGNSYDGDYADVDNNNAGATALLMMVTPAMALTKMPVMALKTVIPGMRMAFAMLRMTMTMADDCGDGRYGSDCRSDIMCRCSPMRRIYVVFMTLCLCAFRSSSLCAGAV